MVQCPLYTGEEQRFYHDYACIVETRCTHSELAVGEHVVKPENKLVACNAQLIPCREDKGM